MELLTNKSYVAKNIYLKRYVNLALLGICLKK